MALQKPNGATDWSKDELQRLLKERLKKKRPRWLRLSLAILALAFGALAVAAWLLSPRGEAPHLIVVALDGVGMAQSPVMLEGRLEAADGTRSPLAGRDMVFVDAEVAWIARQKTKEVVVKTGPDGDASCPWSFPPDAGHGDFRLRLIGDKFQPGMEDSGRILLLPSAAPLCLVQVDGTLVHVNNDAWQKEAATAIAPMPGAAEALVGIHSKDYQILYVALAADRPTLYQAMRRWVREWSAVGTAPLPAGVVLSRFTLPRSDQDVRPWQKTAELLRSKFVRPQGEKPARHLAIAGTLDAARQFHAAGLRTFYIGAGGDLPEGMERVASWEELRQALEK